MQDIEWLTIPFAPSYEISDAGTVRRRVACKCSPAGKIMALTPHAKGYLRVKLVEVSGNAKSYEVHRILTLAFHGEPPSSDHEACHLNGKSTDNRKDNLVWGTNRENSAHRLIHGTDNRGEKSRRARLTSVDVVAIRSLYEQFGPKRLGSLFEVSASHICRIAAQSSWRHVA